MRRFGQIIGIDPDRVDEYTAHHDAIWPEIAGALTEAEIGNYSIFFHGEHLFAYYEYHGPADEYEERMSAVADAPRMKEWWALVGAMQRPLADRPAGAWWTDMREVFHLAGTDDSTASG
ncbi:L-rhamnose mutarotase [Ilumatobacter sp.]|uniref:L-rhamnose mutarotase n=1 Tax=Ilumatobacter sp. TaxID=1967498 RepID=UPI003C3994DF